MNFQSSRSVFGQKKKKRETSFDFGVFAIPFGILSPGRRCHPGRTFFPKPFPMVLTRAGLASSQKLPTISLLVSIPLPSVQQREKHLPLEKYLLLH